MPLRSSDLSVRPKVRHLKSLQWIMSRRLPGHELSRHGESQGRSSSLLSLEYFLACILAMLENSDD